MKYIVLGLILWGLIDSLEMIIQIPSFIESRTETKRRQTRQALGTVWFVLFSMAGYWVWGW